MSIKVGDRVPHATVYELREGQPAPIDTSELFTGKRVVVFALPGAFTPTCSAKHLPGFIEHADQLAAGGVDEIVCLSVNDAWVMDAWGKSQQAGSIRMLGDGNADFTTAMGLAMDGAARGLGTRSQRYAMVVDNGVVSVLEVDESPASCDLSGATHILAKL